MNEDFRNYAFGRAFAISLRESHIKTLAALCRGDEIASYGFGGSEMHGLLRRGLVEYVPDINETRYRPTRAGVLVFDLLVEAGEYSAMLERRREAMEKEWQLDTEKWNERFGDIQVRLRDRFLRDDGKPDA